MNEEEKRALKTKRSADKLRHVIDELIETEVSYGNDLKVLMATYLKPLKVTGMFPHEEVC